MGVRGTVLLDEGLGKEVKGQSEHMGSLPLLAELSPLLGVGDRASGFVGLHRSLLPLLPSTPPSTPLCTCCFRRLPLCPPGLLGKQRLSPPLGL